MGTTITVSRATPQLSWTTPGPITYPTALTSTQLDASANVAGTFAYSPPAGTVLHVGGGQPLSATFTPSDTTDYSSGGQVRATITVNQGTPQLTWITPAAISYPTPLSSTQLDASANVGGSFAYGPHRGHGSGGWEQSDVERDLYAGR